MIKLINDNFKITTILSKGIQTDYLTASLLEQFEEKDVLLWQDKNMYFPCKRIQLSFGVDLLELLKQHIEEFNVLIINKFKYNVSSQDIKTFIESISAMEEMKDKQVIIFVSTNANDIELKHCFNLESTIKNYSDQVLTLNKTKPQEYILQNLINGEIIKLKEQLNGYRTQLLIIE